MFLWMDKILIAIDQSPSVSMMGGKYVVLATPGAFFFVQYDSTKRLLQSILFAHISTYTQVIATAFHLVFCIIFIQNMNLGVTGAALAFNLTHFCNFAMQEIYVRWIGWKYFNCVIAPYLTKETFNFSSWCTFLKFGIPSTLLVCFEWWAFELLAIWAGWIEPKWMEAE
jgi:MATE family multidrug resistance protein